MARAAQLQPSEPPNAPEVVAAYLAAPDNMIAVVHDSNSGHSDPLSSFGIRAVDSDVKFAPIPVLRRFS